MEPSAQNIWIKYKWGKSHSSLLDATTGVKKEIKVGLKTMRERKKVRKREEDEEIQGGGKKGTREKKAKWVK